MIHLDRNHPLSPQNLILPTSNPDHHKIISWPQLDNIQDHQPHFLSDTKPPPNDLPSITPVNADQPPLPRTSTPSSPDTHTDAISAPERSSSLSPPPESFVGSPRPPPDVADPPPQQQRLIDEKKQEQQEQDKDSRQSTPLTELSPVPDPSDIDVAEADVKSEVEPEQVPKNAVVVEGRLEQVRKGDEPSSKDKSPPELSSSTLVPPQPILATSPAQRASESPSQPGEPAAPSPAFQAPSNSSPSHNSSTQAPAATIPNSGIPPLSQVDPKVVRILELNAELLKACIEFQARGIPILDPRSQQFTARLQGNLTWLAAAADHSRQGNHTNLSLPIMDSPSPVDFISMDRIQQLYADMPIIFAKEVERRQQMGIPISNVPLVPPTMPPNGSLKRDRSEDGSMDPGGKRRDTGESKSMQVPIIPGSVAPAPMTNNAMPQAPNNFQLPASGGNPAGMPHPPPHLSSPSVPQHGLAHSVSSPTPGNGPTDAQIAASSRERTRQMQIRQAIHMQQQQQQQGNRQMSPPSGPVQQQQPPMMGQNAVAGPSSIPNQNQGQPINGAAALAALGPNAMQNFQLLQNPENPFVDYMAKSIPGFRSMPLQQQLQKMQMVQAAIQAKQLQSQNSAMAQQQFNGNLPQGAAAPHLQNNNMPVMSQFPGARPGSSASQHQSTMPQQQMNSISQQPGLMFPFASPHNHGGQQNDPRSSAGPSSNMNPQQLQALAAAGNMSMNNPNGLNPQQRQLLLLHQSQMVRGPLGGVNGNAPMNPGFPGGMMNPQQQMFVAQERMRQEQQQQQQQQQRMAGQGQGQASSPPHSRSPMSMAANDSFPALRSNSAIPGIARSTRSPSESAPSPMTPRVPTRATSHHEEYQRAMLQAQQHQAQAARAMAGQSPAFNQHMQGPSSSWQQNQQQQQAMQMGHGGPGSGAGPGANFRMTPPGSATSFGGAPSPITTQNWPQQGVIPSGHYPFAPSPNSAGGHGGQHGPDQPLTPRHTSSTPAPAQHQSPTEQGNLNDLDFFNWS